MLEKEAKQIVRDLIIRVRLFPLWPLFLRHEVRQTERGIVDLGVALRRWSCDVLDPSYPPKPVPQVPGELGHLDDWRDGNKQREDLKNVSFFIDVPCVGAYLAETKRERVVRCAVSAELYDTNPIPHGERDDRHELDKWIVISDRPPIPLDQHRRPSTRGRVTDQTLTKRGRYGSPGGQISSLLR